MCGVQRDLQHFPMMFGRMDTNETDTRKKYVKVNSDFDSTGYMMPRTITWADGRTFKIDEVKDFRPASTLAKGHSGDCYTVVIRGEEKFLFFEKTDDLFASRVGRWFVERSVAV